MTQLRSHPAPHNNYCSRHSTAGCGPRSVCVCGDERGFLARLPGTEILSRIEFSFQIPPLGQADFWSRHIVNFLRFKLAFYNFLHVFGMWRAGAHSRLCQRGGTPWCHSCIPARTAGYKCAPKGQMQSLSASLGCLTHQCS